MPHIHYRLSNPNWHHRHPRLVRPGEPGCIRLLPHYPFRNLLKPTTPFNWTVELDTTFKASKVEIVGRIQEGVAIFDKNRPTCLATDWSKDGIGYWLFKKHCQRPSREIFCCREGWRITLVGSRFTHPAESRYAPVGGGSTGSGRRLRQGPTLCPRVWRPRRSSGPQTSCSATVTSTTETIHTVTAYQLQSVLPYPQSPSTGKNQVATATDPTMRELEFVIEEGPPDKRHMLPASIREYYPIIQDLTTIDGVLCYGERLIIPSSLRPTCLTALHAAHQGTSSMTARATSSLYWPGMTTDISKTRNQCNICNQNAPSQPAMPSTTPEEPEYPFQHICADYFHHEGSAYLVLVDRYSGWPIVAPAQNGATGLTSTLRETFATFGIPTTLTSDGGPEFASHSTRELLSSWGVQHRTSAAYNPHANNRAKTAVKTMKRLIAGNTGPGGSLNTNFYKALLLYRNGPSPDTRCPQPSAYLVGPSVTCSRDSQIDTCQLQHREQALSRRRTSTLGRTPLPPSLRRHKTKQAVTR